MKLEKQQLKAEIYLGYNEKYIANILEEQLE